MRPVHIVLAIAVAVVWGFNFVVIRVGLNHFPPILFSALRFTASAIPLAFFLPRPKVAWSIVFGIGFFLGVVKFTLLFEGMAAGVPAGLSSLVLQSQVFFTVILSAILLKDRPSARQIAGIAIAFCGIALIGFTVDGSVTLPGLSLVIGAALAWACSNVLMKRAGSVNMLQLIVWVCLIPPLPLLALSLLFEGWEADYAALLAFSWSGFGAVLFTAWVSTVVGFGLWGMLIRTYGAAQVVPFALLVPVFGMSSSALFLGESFGPLRLFAAVLVIVGLVLTVVKPLPFQQVTRV